MRGAQAKRIRRTAHLLYVKNVLPEIQRLSLAAKEAGDGSPKAHECMNAALELPTVRRLYKRLKFLYVRRAS